MTETTQEDRDSLHEIADEYSRCVFAMFEQNDYVLPNIFRGFIAVDMQLLAEHVAKRQKEIESVRSVIDRGIQDGLERRLAAYERACVRRSEGAPEWAERWHKTLTGDCMFDSGAADYEAGSEKVSPAPDLRPDIEGPVTLPVVSI